MIFYIYLLFTYIALPVATLGIYFLQVQSVYPPELLSGLIMSAAPGIFLYYWFMNQFVTGSRVKLIERGIGLPTVIRVHITATSGIILLLFFHGFVVHGILSGIGSFAALLGVLAGSVFIGLYIIAVGLWAETWISRLPVLRGLKRAASSKLRYKHFKMLHNLNALAALLVFWHVAVSSFAQESPAAFILMIAFFILSFGSYVFHKAVRPLLLRRRRLCITGIQAENESITTLYFEQTSGSPLRYKAGQFGFFRFISGALKGEEHPFSFSSASNEPRMSITVRHSGSFTNRLRAGCKAGDTLVCDAPYGTFCVDADTLVHGASERSVTFIAGGIGIAPFLGILQDIAKSRAKLLDEVPAPQHERAEKMENALLHRCTLHWLTSGHEDAFGKKVVSEARRLFSAHMYSRSKNLPLTKEMFTAEPNFLHRSYYICASFGVTRTVMRMLKSLGIPKKNIHYELFSM